MPRSNHGRPTETASWADRRRRRAGWTVRKSPALHRDSRLAVRRAGGNRAAEYGPGSSSARCRERRRCVRRRSVDRPRPARARPKGRRAWSSRQPRLFDRMIDPRSRWSRPAIIQRQRNRRRPRANSWRWSTRSATPSWPLPRATRPDPPPSSFRKRLRKPRPLPSSQPASRRRRRFRDRRRSGEKLECDGPAVRRGSPGLRRRWVGGGGPNRR